MAWLAVNKNGTEMVFPEKPVYDGWDCEHVEFMEFECEQFYVPTGIELPKGSIQKLAGRIITFSDGPIEIK